MLRGNWNGKVLGSGSDAWKFWDERRAGNISDAEWSAIEGGIARSHGHCMTMGTASTMTAIADVIGMTLPGTSSIPADDVNHMRMCAAAGRRIVDMVWEDLKPSDIMTRASFENAIRVAMAMGCSTNAVIHVIAMARRAGHHVTLDDFDAASRIVPVIANVRPSGDTYLMEDFYYAGGLKALMTEIAPLLDLEQITVSGKRWAEELDGVKVHNADVIRSMDTAIYPEGALAVLKGNLAPRGCVIKPSACAPHLRKHTGPAIVFDDYPSMKAVIDRDDFDVTPDHILDPAQCRAAGRAGHAGMGHAADPQEAGEAGRARHAAHFRRAHERHELWRLHPACFAGILRRRPAGAGADGRHDLGGRRRPVHHARGGRGGAAAPQVAPEAPCRRASSAAMASCSPSTSARRTKAATSISCRSDFGGPTGEPAIF